MVRSVHIGSLAAHNAHTGGAARTQRFSVAAPVVFLLIRVFTFLFVITQKRKETRRKPRACSQPARCTMDRVFLKSRRI